MSFHLGSLDSIDSIDSIDLKSAGPASPNQVTTQKSSRTNRITELGPGPSGKPQPLSCCQLGCEKGA